MFYELGATKLGRWEFHDITKEEFEKATGGVMPDVDPKDIIAL